MVNGRNRLHKRANGTSNRNFKSNRKHFIEGVDYYKLSLDEIRLMSFGSKSNYPNGLTILTESGYLLLVKSLTDDLAWDVQRELVKNYFRLKEVVETVKATIKPSSVGEIVAFGKFIRSLMKDQNATPHQIAETVVEGIKQFGVKFPQSTLLPVSLKDLNKVKDDELDIVEFAYTFPNSSYQDYLLYRAMIKRGD
jgi:hypothetical protein